MDFGEIWRIFMNHNESVQFGSCAYDYGYVGYMKSETEFAEKNTAHRGKI